jgi:DNA-binding GntR family transcriptional regulator
MAEKQKDKKTFRVKAYQEIKDRITYLVLKPGEKIFENEIAESLGISRTPVREALLLLENEQLVECLPRLGYMVKRLTNPEIVEYFSLRRTLEIFAVPLIIERITDEEIEALRENLREAETSVTDGDLRSIIRCETEFHQILYGATKSDIFSRTILSLVDNFQLIRAIAMMAPGGRRESVSDHKCILEAIERRDGDELLRLMKEHIDRATEMYRASPAAAIL